jgi:hypothetical protein
MIRGSEVRLARARSIDDDGVAAPPALLAVR